MPEEIKIPEPNWKGIFMLYSWWLDPSSNRLFVIVYLWYDNDGKIESIDLLEQNKQETKLVLIADMINYFRKDLLQVASKMQDF